MQRRYTPLTNNQLKVIKSFLNWRRKRTLSLRRVFDTILYITRTGCQWRNLSQTRFPAWNAVYYYFRQWSLNGTLDRINLALNQLERGLIGRNPLPSLGLVDSQSIKLAPMIFEDRGVDGNKKVNGRKRHIITDVRGRIYCVHLHAANLHDSPLGQLVCNTISYSVSSGGPYPTLPPSTCICSCCETVPFVKRYTHKAFYSEILRVPPTLTTSAA